MKIRFDSYKNPTTLRKFSTWLIALGTLLIFAEIILLYSLSFQPLELKIFYLFEVRDLSSIQLFVSGILVATTGLTLRKFSWRKGLLNIKSDKIFLNSSDVEIGYEFSEILRLKLLNIDQIEIRTRENSIRLNFKASDDLAKFWSVVDERTEDVIIGKINVT